MIDEPLPTASEPMRFESIDEAVIFERKIFSNSKAIIWLSRLKSPASGEYVIVKELDRAKVSSSQQTVEHVYNERTILALLGNENFPRSPHLIATAKNDDSLFLVMSMVEGAPLHAHIPRDGFPMETARRYFAETLSIMEYLHDRNIVYRDLKLSNLILRSEDGRICICDFGHAKRLERTEGRTGSVCGTQHAMAPEVKSASSLGNTYGKSCDFWTLGVLLYELIEGVPPFGQTGVGEAPPAAIIFRSQKHTEESRGLIKQLLRWEVEERLCSIEGIRSHSFFSGLGREWWANAHWDAQGNADPWIPEYDPWKGRKYLFGHQGGREEEEEDWWNL